MRCSILLFTALITTYSSSQSANQYTVLHYFHFQPAANPATALIPDSVGNFYGTATSSDTSCGITSCGTVFKLTRELGDGWKYSIVHRFHGRDGASPVGGLVFDTAGNLYGTTFNGGTDDEGTVFELSPSGSAWKERVLYSFRSSGSDLMRPVGALTLDKNGNLYGPAEYGGPGQYGGIFELHRAHNGWQEKVVHAFTGGSDGGGPYVGELVFDSAGNLYGTAGEGGKFNQGVVFELSPSSRGSWTETVLHDFTGGADGGQPRAGVVFDAAGNLYGAATLGASSSCIGGCGTIFELTPSIGEWVLTVLHTFNVSDGSAPVANLIFDSVGNIFGSTLQGGKGNYGVVFRLSPSGSDWTATTLHDFQFRTGTTPYDRVTFDSVGNLYGTAWGGGEGDGFGLGTIFKISP